ncbi:hypothetical protein B6D60_05245 [candidate division KSB1 bacterium 4484_87]|nr:MAG: hypothetical protein B6D60_05245 [candidate division KSB1 bacterium 4484_87]
MITNQTVRPYIIVIDDDQVMRLSCLKILKKEGYEVATFVDGVEGLENIYQRKPDLVVVDLKMPRLSGMEVISRVHAIDPDICIVVITGYATIGTAVDAMKNGAYDFLPKPFTPDELRLIVRRGLERRMFAKKTAELKKEKQQMQRRFVTFVSHQLQSPLAAVKQYLEVLNFLPDTPDKQAVQKEWIDRSLARISELLELISDWLTISKIESGQLTECTGDANLVKIFNDLKTTFQPECDKKNIFLNISIPEHLPPVPAREDCLRVLFNNLIHNSIKYNKTGGSVQVQAEEKENSIEVLVKDSGIGIPDDKIDLIFEDFYRVKSENTKKIPGTGLGLPICKKIVEELGGAIEVDSKLNVGTAFRINLPKGRGEKGA